MTRITSLEAYQEIERTGKLTQLRLAVLHFVATHQGCTQRDAENYLQQRLDKKNYSSVTARFSYLEDEGYIKTTGKRYQDGANRLTYEMVDQVNTVDQLTTLARRLELAEARAHKHYAVAGAIREKIAKLKNKKQLEIFS